MRRFPLPETWRGESECVVSGKAARKLVRVLRLGPGDGFPAISAEGELFDCTILRAETDSVRLSVRAGPPLDVQAGIPDTGARAPGFPLPDVRKGGKRADAERVQPLPGKVPDGGTAPGFASPESCLPAIRLAVSLLKGSKLDEVVRAATEAGVSEILLLATERCVARPEGASRAGRLRRIADEAVAQSGSTIRTRVADPVALGDFLERERAGPNGNLKLFCHETPLASGTLHRYCTDIQCEVPGTVTVCVGPEGGFSPSEVGEFLERGFLPVSLGPTVLRAETAAIFAIAALRVILMERSAWQASDRNE